MGKPFEIKIESILDGIAPSSGFSGESQFSGSIGIDPEFPATDTGVRPSGWIRPTAMEKFSAAKVDAPVLWFETNPKDTNVYAYLNNGTFISYSSSLGSETTISNLATASGNGMTYYDNYIYLSRNTDIARYGPLDGSPAIDVDAWTTSPLGSQTTMQNTTYPSINGVAMPNHVMHRHTDDAVYIADVHASDYGIINKIKTSKTTVQGDTDDGSTYNALDFDHGIYPVALAEYQQSLAVAVIEGVNTTIRQGTAKISFWDTTSNSFSLITDDEFPDPLITALLNVNGTLYVASGSASGGCRLSRYVGGYTHEEIWYNADIYPPLQGAMAHLLKRVVFGSNTTYPEASASVFASGSTFGNGVHNILKTTSTGANPQVTAVKYVQNSAFPRLAPIVAWQDDSANGIDKLSTTYGVNVWRSPTYRIGERFEVSEIQIPLAAAVASNMTITPKVFIDDESDSTTLAVINSTNYPNTDKEVSVFGPVIGEKDFCIELRWTGTVLLPVSLPITIKGRMIH